MFDLVLERLIADGIPVGNVEEERHGAVLFQNKVNVRYCLPLHLGANQGQIDVGAGPVGAFRPRSVDPHLLNVRVLTEQVVHVRNVGVAQAESHRFSANKINELSSSTNDGKWSCTTRSRIWRLFTSSYV